MVKVLIICTGNTCRSPMAEGIVNDIIKKEHLENEMQVDSMGFSAYDGEIPTANAVECMKELGIDIAGHCARRVTIEDIEQSDIIYVMTENHKNIIVDTVPDYEDRILVLDVPDPFGCDLEVYRECRDKIKDFFEYEFNNRLGEVHGK